MSRGIDHLVLATRDLKSASDLYEQLGFTLTPQAQHPFGTGNRLAQLEGEFLEIVSVTRAQDLIEHQQGRFSFGAYNRDYLLSREGMSMIALKSDGWRTDRQTFTDAGFALPDPFTFSRKARQPDGNEVTVGFDLTFVPDDQLPEALFFTCDHQHEARFFYKPEFQKHANGALAVTGVFMLADDPANVSGILTRLYGSDQGSEKAASQPIVLSAEQLHRRFPGHGEVVLRGGAVFAGYRIQVSDLEDTRNVLATNGVAFADKGQCLWLTALGAIIEFSASPKGGNLQ